MTLYSRIEACAAPHGLMAMGVAQADGRFLVLLGADAGFWDVFTTSAEARDGATDPVDRWSRRVVGQVAAEVGALDVEFPFGGPPYAPFIAWAKNSQEAFASPVGMLVHLRAGLMISYRGALVFDAPIGAPVKAHSSPCTTCKTRPCETACPVGALQPGQDYDVAACKDFLRRPEGKSCLTRGCKVRRACPISAGFARPEVQSAYHMRRFLGE